MLMTGLASAAGSTVAGNIALLTHPVLAVLAPGHGPLWRSAYLGGLMAFAALWAAMQRAQIEGGEFMAFAGSLPFSRRQRRRVDLAVLVLADGPLLLLLAAAIALTAGRHAPAAHLALLADIVLLALLVQLAVLERRPAGAAFVAAACVLLGASFGTAAAAALAVLAGGAAAALIAQPVAARARRSGKARSTRPAFTALLARLAGRHGPALQVSLATLYREGRNEVIAKVGSAAGAVTLALALVEVFERDSRSLPTILLAQGVVALTCSGVFRRLAMAHAASSGYLGALPLPKRWYAWTDLAAALTLGLPFIAALAAYGVFAGAAGPARMAVSVLSYLLLLCALRAPQLFSERHAVVLSTVLAGCWTAATIACLN